MAEAEAGTGVPGLSGQTARTARVVESHCVVNTSWCMQCFDGEHTSCGASSLQAVVGDDRESPYSKAVRKSRADCTHP